MLLPCGSKQKNDCCIIRVPLDSYQFQYLSTCAMLLSCGAPCQKLLTRNMCCLGVIAFYMVFHMRYVAAVQRSEQKTTDM